MTTDVTSTAALEATPARLHRLVYARLLPEDARAFVAADPRTSLEMWRGFARSTLIPLGAGLALIAIGLAVGAWMDEPRDVVVPLSFLIGALLAAAVASVVAGRRALLPASIGVVLAGGAILANVVGVRALRREDDVTLLVFVVALLAIASVIARTRPRFAPLEVALAASLPLEDARARAAAFLASPSTARAWGAVAVWIVGGPLAFAAVIASMDERSLGPARLAVGAVLLVAGAVISRSRKPLVVVRQVGLLAFVAGVLCLAGTLADNRAIDRELRVFATVPVLVIAWLAVRSWPLRALWGALLAAVVLAGIERLSLRPEGPVEMVDDVTVVILAALASFAMTRGLYVRPVAAAACFALLVFASVELPMIGPDLGLGLGTFTSLGVIACLVAVVLVVLRGASVAARALVAAFVAFAGTLFLDMPALLIAGLVVVLGRHARVRSVEIVGALGVLVATFARLHTPWVVLGERAVTVAIAAVVVLAVALTLRRLPTTR